MMAENLLPLNPEGSQTYHGERWGVSPPVHGFRRRLFISGIPPGCEFIAMQKLGPKYLESGKVTDPLFK